MTWRSGRCLPYGDGIGFWALAEIVAAHAGILETDDQATLSAKLDAVLTEPDPNLRSWMKDRLGPLVGLAVAASSPQEDETFAAWRRFLEGIAHAGPLVLIVEDLHWADEAFVRFLVHLAGNSTGLPLDARGHCAAGDRGSTPVLARTSSSFDRAITGLAVRSLGAGARDRVPARGDAAAPRQRPRAGGRFAALRRAAGSHVPGATRVAHSASSTSPRSPRTSMRS